MFKQISWNNYIATIILLSIAYYLFLAVRYYRKDVIKIFANKNIISGENLSWDFQKPMIQKFSIQVRAFLFEAVNNNLNKEDVVRSIQMLIRKYPGIKDMTFRNSIEQLIVEECAESIHLSKQDLRELWN